MARHVLVAVDDTDVSERTFEYALSEFPEASVTVIHVLSTSARAEDFVDGGVDRADVEAAAADVLDDAREAAADRGREVDVVETSGSPPRAIVDHLESGDYDLVVVGTHGRQGTERMLAGSVAEEVVRTSPVPVLVYR